MVNLLHYCPSASCGAGSQGCPLGPAASQAAMWGRSPGRGALMARGRRGRPPQDWSPAWTPPAGLESCPTMNFFLDLIWLIPLFPLCGALLMLLFGRLLDPQPASDVAVAPGV